MINELPVLFCFEKAFLFKPQIFLIAVYFKMCAVREIFKPFVVFLLGGIRIIGAVRVSSFLFLFHTHIIADKN